ncbi:succinate dehydrogenase assembly factor 4, mitochondrial-like [Centruroides sculpturatus]|uniref:succinate dehydrogenase assembly factor 4, mitochondrial-like n=1 Tax=Centruroides sculpturatus TaxID=218467 RepID=UPI000C6E8EF6|nr:succinate dehydrogenase assembly factor 4, mitochondrial-like [Centruroides sculpturatus]
MLSTGNIVRQVGSLCRCAIERQTAIGAVAWQREIGTNVTGTNNSTTPLPKVIQKVKTPLGKLDQQTAKHKKNGECDPFAPFPNHTNPVTGEIGGPTGPEPTRYGDWERKGRVSDF